MTIQKFARLCSCSAQTLRYYDKIGLLKPVQVDPWTGYRHYDSAQALDFVKIKNLQAADFTIEEIKVLLSQSDAQVYAAFDRKIAEQIRKLERIQKIQQSYLAEKNTMKNILHSIADYLLRHCRNWDLLPEFGLSPEDRPRILERLREYLHDGLAPGLTPGKMTMQINDEQIQGEEAILDRIQSLTEQNLKDTILLGDSAQDADERDWACLFERRGWVHAAEFLEQVPLMAQDVPYLLQARLAKPPSGDDLSYPMFLVGALLLRQPGETILLSCDVSNSPDGENLFRLLGQKA